MRSATRFVRCCPTCGRNLDIPVAQIGRMVMCSHCQAEFQATLASENANDDFEQSLDQRIDRLLAGTSSVLQKPHFENHHTNTPRTYEV